VITVLTVDAALQRVCAIFHEQANRGDITSAERDLLVDGAILLAMHVDDLARDGRRGSRSGCAITNRAFRVRRDYSGSRVCGTTSPDS